MHGSSKLKKILIFYFTFTLPFYFLLFMHFILRVSLLTASPSLLSSSTDLLSIADLTSPTATDPSVLLCTHSVSIEKDQATPLAVKSGGQYQLGLYSSVKTVKLCPLAQVSSVGTETDRVSGMGFGLAVLIFLGSCFVLLHWF